MTNPVVRKVRRFEIVRLDWPFKVGGPPDPRGMAPVIVNALCNFMRQKLKLLRRSPRSPAG